MVTKFMNTQAVIAHIAIAANPNQFIMNFKIIKKLPNIDTIIQEFPLPQKAQQKIAKDRKEIKNIFSGKDHRLLIVVGPCSAWPYKATFHYAQKLQKLNQKLSKKLKIIMRVYTQKPRTSKGWTGPINQPDPFSPPNIEEGMRYARKLMIQILKLGLPIADEAVFPHHAKGFLELLSWVAIGARSTENPEHRIFASAIDCPVGMKNPTSGSIEIAVNSLIAGQNTHTAVMNESQVQTQGNPFAHLVLRGGIDRPNYHIEDLYHAKKSLKKAKILNPAIIVDASHDNCKIAGIKNPDQQINVVQEVLTTLKSHPDLRKFVKGFMFESFLKNGCQKLENVTQKTLDLRGLSLTDPCLSWDQTEELLKRIAEE